MFRAADTPRLWGLAMRTTSNSRAMSRDRSVLASSTTMTSSGAWFCAKTEVRQARRVFS
ncbi:hypothetical protein STANM309S_00573 [Streptomyces tanashiensis]